MINTLKKKAWILVLLLILTNVFWLYLAYEKRTFPFYELKELALKTVRFIKTQQVGSENFVEKTISAQESKVGETLNTPDSLIETAILPLNKKYTSLTSVSFAKAGGALTLVKDKLILLDRLGRLYSYNGETTAKLSFVTPNNVKDFILNYSGTPGINSDALRAHSLAFDKNNSRLLVSFTRYDEKDITRLVVASIAINTEDLTASGTWKTIFESQPLKNKAAISQSGGGKIYIKDQFAYLSVGYAAYKEIDNKLYAASQDKDSTFGRIYRINLNNDQNEILSIGHRNVQGISSLNQSEFVSTEHGPQGGDEINLIQKGSNFGWPLETYGTRYGTYDYTFDLPPSTLPGKLSTPLFSFVPSIGISSIIQIKNFNSRWDGDLLVGSLKAQSLYRLKYIDGRIVFSEPIWIGHRIRDAILYNNKITLLTDDSNLITLDVNDKALRKNTKGDNLIAKNSQLAKCIVCHQFSETTPASLAPSLSNIYQRKIGSDTFSRYSPALAGFEGKWSEANLKKFIADPSEFLPGSTMPALGLNQGEVDNIVELLISQ